MDWEVLARLAVAAGLSAAIGIDRELRSKPAGLRTNIVVSVAAAAFAYLGAEAFGFPGDPTRVASQVVSGIGFLGGGAIFAAGGKPHGLTTAAALWGSAAIGIAAGMGQFAVAIVIVVVTFVALWPLDILAGKLLRKVGRRDLHVHLMLDNRQHLRDVQRILGPAEVRVLEADLRDLGDGVLLEMVLSGKSETVDGTIAQLRRVESAVLLSDLRLSNEEG